MQPVAQLGEYQLLEKLGEGGMGAVYKALHTKLDRMVALKVLPKDRALGRAGRGPLRAGNEGRRGAWIIPTSSGPWTPGRSRARGFLVMEYVDGLDLNALGRACHPLPIADACEIVRQAALGLEHAHEHGLVHRDIKPLEPDAHAGRGGQDPRPGPGPLPARPDGRTRR